MGSFDLVTTVDFEIYARAEKRDISGGDNYALDAILEIYDPLTTTVLDTLTIALDATGYVLQPGVALPAGTGYEVYLKGRSHLAEKLASIDVVLGTTIELNFSGGAGGFGVETLSAGDVQGSWPGTKDNQVDILDISVIDTYLNQSNTDADLNADGVVDALDMSTALSNFNQVGEALP